MLHGRYCAVGERVEERRGGARSLCRWPAAPTAGLGSLVTGELGAMGLVQEPWALQATRRIDLYHTLATYFAGILKWGCWAAGHHAVGRRLGLSLVERLDTGLGSRDGRSGTVPFSSAQREGAS